MCCDMLLQMVFIHNFVHGDLHPGNIMVKMTEKGPTVCLLDCGIVTQVTKRDHKAFIDICIALLKFKGHDAAKLMMDYRGITDEGAVERFCDGIQDIVEQAKRERAFEHISEYVSRICNLACQYKVALMPDLLNVAMAVKVCEGIALALNPDLELALVAIPTVLEGQARYLKEKYWG